MIIYRLRNGLYRIEHDGAYKAPWVVWKYDQYNDAYTTYVTSHKTRKSAELYLLDRGGKRV